MPASWGGVARRGARQVELNDEDAGKPFDATFGAPTEGPPQQDVWVRTDGADLRRSGGEKIQVATKRIGANERQLPADVAAAIRKTAESATAHRREVLVSYMTDAMHSYDRHRYGEAIASLRPLLDEVPDVIAVRELAGLANYRGGRWRDAARHLDVYFTLSGDPQYLPAEMDCQRALGHPKSVKNLYERLRELSPEADVLAEARIVYAGSLADNNQLTEAIAVLVSEGGAKMLRNPSGRHIRQWYALADLYDRAGDLPAAREWFARVLMAEPDAYDVRDRLEALGSGRPKKNRKKTAVPVSKKKI
jgi:tetratricopeptide (TPR) repeat protein